MLNELNICYDKRQVLNIKGEISFENCMYIKDKVVKYLEYKNMKDISIDISSLKSGDSSIILLIISVIRLSKNKKVTFVDISDNLTKLMKSYKLYDILSINK